MQILNDITKSKEENYLEYLRSKQAELTERLALSYLSLAREQERSQEYDDAIDVYGKALKALENANHPNTILEQKIAKSRGLALARRIDKMSQLKSLNKVVKVTGDDLKYIQEGEVSLEFSSRSNLTQKRPSSNPRYPTRSMANMTRQMQSALTVNGKQTSKTKALNEPIWSNESQGRYVIKKSNFMINKKIGAGYTNRLNSYNQNDEHDSKISNDVDINEALDAADVQAREDLMDDVLPPDKNNSKSNTKSLTMIK